MAPRFTRRLGGAFGLSAMLHLTLAIAVLMFLSGEAARAPDDTPPFPSKFVFIASTPAAGGGGGGHPDPAPAQPLEIPPHRTPVAVTVTPVVATPAPDPTPVLDVPVETDAAKLLRAAGLSVTVSAAPGGGGRGTTAGRGEGDGVEPGRDRGVGGDAYHAGGDVSAPTLLRRVEPRYTSEAMMSKIAGVVVLEAVVRADGTIGAVRVLKSLDARYGLDRAAIDAAKQWLFKPGMRRGQPVDVIVTLILDFRLH
jgi:protein TonB